MFKNSIIALQSCYWNFTHVLVQTRNKLEVLTQFHTYGEVVGGEEEKEGVRGEGEGEREREYE